MATQQVLVTTPSGNATGSQGIAVAPESNDPAATTKEAEQVRTFTGAVVLFMVTGISGLVLGSADLALNVVAIAYGSTVALSFSGVWGGFIFGAVNGALALKASREKPQVSKRWVRVLYGFGIAAVVVHFVDLILVLAGTAICSVNAPRTYRINTPSSTYYLYYYSPATPEAARIPTLVVLITLEIWQIALADRLRRLLLVASATSTTTVSYTVVTVNPGQLDYGQMQQPANFPMTAPQTDFNTLPPAYTPPTYDELPPGLTYSNQMAPPGNGKESW